LNDLYKFDILHRTWHYLGTSSKLYGRVGTHLISLNHQTQIAIVAGRTEKEHRSDGQIYDLYQQQWDRIPLTIKLDGIRPRSGCVHATFQHNGIALLFGGQVNPLDRGHVGPGPYTNDLVILDEQLGFHVATIPSPEEKRTEQKMSNQQVCNPKLKWHDRDHVPDINVDKYKQSWPHVRADAAADSYETDGIGYMYLFGGLSGTTDPQQEQQQQPTRWNDLWKLEVCHI
jgi:hypothetical protein